MAEIGVGCFSTEFVETSRNTLQVKVTAISSVMRYLQLDSTDRYVRHMFRRRFRRIDSGRLRKHCMGRRLHFLPSLCEH